MAQVQMGKKEDLQRMIERWRSREERIGRNAEALRTSTKSYFVQIMANAIHRDAEKRSAILKAILDCMDCTVTITPEELGELSQLLRTHVDVEKEAHELAEVALKKRQPYITSYLLKYMLEDEKKNVAFMNQLNELKSRIYPYA